MCNLISSKTDFMSFMKMSEPFRWTRTLRAIGSSKYFGRFEAMLKPSRIDDPFEASLNAWPEEAENEAGETAIAAVGVLSELAGIFGNIRDRFRNESRFARFNYLLEGARLKFAQLEGRVVQVVAELDQVKQGLASKEFREAATTAAEEAVRAGSL